jgi:glycerol-3-phosphate acyltransferase PlsY
LTLPIALTVAYLLGSIPTSYIVGYLITGRDIRTLGNGNPGMMNVWDSVGLRPALMVGLGDVGKGMAAVSVAYWLGFDHGIAILCGIVAILGHDFSVFLRFDGGNGTAAGVGVLLALVPEATVPAAGLAVVVTLVTRSKRMGGLLGLLAVPAFALWQEEPTIMLWGILGVLTVVALKIIRFEGFTPARSRPPR